VTNETPAWVLPEEPVPVRMMNTIWADTSGVHDDLTNQASLREWLAAVHDQDADTLDDPTPDELADARLLRDALRRLAAFCTDDARPAAQSPIDSVDKALGAVNEALTHRPHAHLALRDGRLHLDNPAHASPTRTDLAELARDAMDLLTGPTAAKLRACHAPRCVLYFVKTHPRREWCSETCGNRARAARHYQKIRSQRR
jgi:predicted RNA-binding Zn ribbon-like protein